MGVDEENLLVHGGCRTVHKDRLAIAVHSLKTYRCVIVVSLTHEVLV